METSYVYQNERSKKIILLGIIVPMVPLFIYVLCMFIFDLDSIYSLFIIIYICFWIGLFALILTNVYEVMVVYKDRIVFINPFKRKEFELGSIKMIYYHAKRGISFNLKDGRIVKMGFNFKYEKDILEELFRRLTLFIKFSEEHLPRSSIYCLVNNR